MTTARLREQLRTLKRNYGRANAVQSGPKASMMARYRRIMNELGLQHGTCLACSKRRNNRIATLEDELRSCRARLNTLAWNIPPRRASGRKKPTIGNLAAKYGPGLVPRKALARKNSLQHLLDAVPYAKVR